MIKEAIAIFQRSYLASFDELCPGPALFAGAATLFELQLTAVLLTMQWGEGESGATEAADRPRRLAQAILCPTESHFLCRK